MSESWLHSERARQGVVLSVIIPTFRGAAVLLRNMPVLLEYLSTLDISFEVLICDDGSNDDGATCRASEELGCIYLAHEVNRGKGAAVRMGMLAARGRYRIFTDADVPFELDAIERALYYLAFKEFHVVAGDRTLAESRYFSEQPLLRRVGSHVFAGLTGRLVTGGWYDTQCGLKGFRQEVAEDLFRVAQVDRFAGDVELLYIALKRNYDIKRLPVKLRSQDVSSVRAVQDGARMFYDLLNIRYHQLRGAYEPLAPEPLAPEAHRPEARRMGDTIEIPGNYQDRALREGPAPQRFWHQAKLDAAVAAVAPRAGERVLDAGCGSGVLAARIAADPAVQVVGVDANEAAIEFARGRFRQPNLEYRLGYVDDLDLPDESFDKIVFIEVIEHLHVPQARALLQSFKRILAPGGKLVITTPNMRSLWPAIEWLLDRFGPSANMAEDQHVAFYTRQSLAQIGLDGGFELVEARTINGVAPWLSALNWDLAEQLDGFEADHDVGLGSLLLQTFEKVT